MAIFDVNYAQENLEWLMAMAMNGDEVIIERTGDFVRFEPIYNEADAGRIWTESDFID